MAMVKAVLLFGSDTWVLTPRLEKALEGFHHLATRRMAGMRPKCKPDGTWVYPPIGAALAMLVLEEIGVYITRHQNTVAQYILIRPIVDLCLAAERKPGTRLSRWWWEQPTLDIMGIGLGQAVEEGEMGCCQRERGVRVGEDDGEMLIW